MRAKMKTQRRIRRILNQLSHMLAFFCNHEMKEYKILENTINYGTFFANFLTYRTALSASAPKRHSMKNTPRNIMMATMVGVSVQLINIYDTVQCTVH